LKMFNGFGKLAFIIVDNAHIWGGNEL